MDQPDLAPELSDQDRLLLVFDYFGPLALFSLVASRREFVKWHAKQGIVVSATLVVLYLVMKAVHILLERIAWKVVAELYWVAVAITGVGAGMLVLLCIVRALDGERFKVPLLGDVADYF